MGKVIGELEESGNIRLYDFAKAQTGEAIPFEQAVKEIEQERDGSITRFRSCEVRSSNSQRSTVGKELG